ncbi:MAG: PhoH family protein [bacterium]
MNLNINLETKEIQNICGPNDTHIKLLSNLYETKISFFQNKLTIDSEDTNLINKVHDLFKTLIEIVKLNIDLTNRDIVYMHKLQNANKLYEAISLYQNSQPVGKTVDHKNIYPKTLNQRIYFENLKSKSIVFGVGVAGTGKTYMAVVYAVNLLKKNHINKIILTRPAVEAGESLGFLPGDLKEKIDPYLRPLYDALHDTLGVEHTKALIEANVIEIAPLAYMRGRTLENAYIILDEAQNTTNMQMKMFLTRLGFKSRMVITGDLTQVDLKNNQTSGLSVATKLLKNIDEIGIVNFESLDVVRHPLVAKIIECYEEN